MFRKKRILSVVMSVVMAMSVVTGISFADSNADTWKKIDTTKFTEAYPAEGTQMRYQQGPGNQALKMVSVNGTEVTDKMIIRDPEYPTDGDNSTGYRNCITDRLDSQQDISFVFNFSDDQCNGVQPSDLDNQTMKNIYVADIAEDGTPAATAASSDDKTIERSGIQVGTGFIPEGGQPKFKGYNLKVTVKAGTLRSAEEYVLVFDKGIAGKVKSGGSSYATLGCQILFYFRTAPVYVSSIALSRTSLKVTEGSTYQLSATVLPENATDRTLKWTSSNEEIASVDESGLVTGKKTGSVTITAEAADGSGVKAQCDVKVEVPKVKSIKLSSTKLTLTAGSSRTVKAVAAPQDARDKTLIWSSSNKKTATVSAAGKIKAVAPGKATITVRSRDGGASAKIAATVKPVKTSISLKAGKRSATVKYKKVNGVTGYQIYRASSKNGKYVKVTSRVAWKSTTYKNTKLKSKKTYWYKVRSYKKAGSSNIYSDFSSPKSVRAK